MKLLVVKLASLGDCIVCLPTIAAIRTKYPTAHITLLTSVDYAELFEGNPHVDRIKVAGSMCPTWRTGHTIYYYDAVVTAELQRESYDELIELNTLNFWGEYRRSGVHLRDHYAAMAGVYPLEDPAYRLYYDPDVIQQELDRRWPTFEVANESGIIAIHKGGGWDLKVMPDHLWIPLIQDLLATTSHAIVFIGQPQDRPSTVLWDDLQAFPGAYDRLYSVTDSVLGLKTLHHLLSQAVLFIGADSGPMHLASAANCPSVVYYAATSQFVGTPTSDWFVTVQSPASCEAPCGLVQCQVHVLCSRLIDPLHLVTAARKVLTRSGQPQEHWIGDHPSHHYFYSWEHISTPDDRPELDAWLHARPSLEPHWVVSP